MKKIFLLALVVMASASFSTISAKDKKKKETKTVAPIELKTSSDSLSYAAGMSMTDGLFPFLKQNYGVDTANYADFVRGYEESIKYKNDPKMKAYLAGLQIESNQVGTRMLPSLENELKDSPDSVNETLFHRGFCDAILSNHTVFVDSVAKKFFNQRMAADVKAKTEKLYGANREAGQKFLAENAKKDSVVTLPDGLQYKILVAGVGEKPAATDKVIVKYEGKLIDGTVFDSSYKRKDQTNTFRCDQVIKGWTEALTMMPIGSKWQIFIPQELAYGERQAGNIKPYSALIFTVELVGIDKPAPAAASTATKSAPAAKTTPAKKAETKSKSKK